VRGSEMSMSEASLVERARHWTEYLCEAEERGHNDFGGAMTRVALHLRLPFGFLKELLYRPPKTISTGRFLALAIAHDERAMEQGDHAEPLAFDPSTPLGRVLLRVAASLDSAADTLDRQDNRDLN